MIKKLQFILLLTVLTAVLNVHAQGGAIVVGDGGTIINCPGKKPLLFDLYEEELLFELTDIKITLDVNGGSLDSMLNTGLFRIQRNLGLTKDEMHSVERIVKVFKLLPHDPWQNPALRAQYGQYLAATTKLIPAFVNQKLKADQCHLELAVINPRVNEMTGYSRQAYEFICSKGFAGIDECLLQNTEVIRSLDKKNKACLIIHEALRFLSFRHRPYDEFQLRRMTAAVCTE